MSWHYIASAAEADALLAENGSVDGRVSEFEAPGWYWAKQHSEKLACGCCYHHSLTVQSPASRQHELRQELVAAGRRVAAIQDDLNEAGDRETMPPPEGEGCE